MAKRHYFRWTDYRIEDLVAHFRKHGNEMVSEHNGHTLDCVFCEDVIRAGDRLRWVRGPRGTAKVKAHRDCAMGMFRRRNPNPYKKVVNLILAEIQNQRGRRRRA